MATDENGILHTTNVAWCGENVVTKKNYSIINYWGTGVNVELPFNCSDTIGSLARAYIYEIADADDGFKCPGVQKLHDPSLQGNDRNRVSNVFNVTDRNGTSFTSGTNNYVYCNATRVLKSSVYISNLTNNIPYYETDEIRNDLDYFQNRMRTYFVHLLNSGFICRKENFPGEFSETNVNFFTNTSYQFQSAYIVNNMINSVLSDFDYYFKPSGSYKYAYKYNTFLSDRDNIIKAILTNYWNNVVILLLTIMYGNVGTSGYGGGGTTVLVPNVDQTRTTSTPYYGTGITKPDSRSTYNTLAACLLIWGGLAQQLVKSFYEYIPNYSNLPVATIIVSNITSSSITITINDVASGCFSYKYSSSTGNRGNSLSFDSNNNSILTFNSLSPGRTYNFNLQRWDVTNSWYRASNGLNDDLLPVNTQSITYTTLSLPDIKTLITSNNFVFYISEANPSTFTYTYSIIKPNPGGNLNIITNQPVYANTTILIENLLPSTVYTLILDRYLSSSSTLSEQTPLNFITLLPLPQITNVLTTSNNTTFLITDPSANSINNSLITYSYTLHKQSLNDSIYSSQNIPTFDNNLIITLGPNLQENTQYIFTFNRNITTIPTIAYPISSSFSDLISTSITTIKYPILSQILITSNNAVFSATDDSAPILQIEFSYSYSWSLLQLDYNNITDASNISLSTPFLLSGLTTNANSINLYLYRIVSSNTRAIKHIDTLITTFATIQSVQSSKLFTSSNNAVFSITDPSATPFSNNFPCSYAWSLSNINPTSLTLSTPFLISELSENTTFNLKIYRNVTIPNNIISTVIDETIVQFNTVQNPLVTKLLTSSNNARFSYEDTTISNPLSYPISYSYLTTVGATILTTPQIITQNPFFVNGFLPDVSNSIQFRRTAIVSGISVIDNYVSYNITPIALPVVNIILTSTTIMFYVIIDISLSTLATYSYSYDISNSITSKINQSIPSPFTIPLFVKDLTPSTPYAFNVNRNIQYSGINQTIVDTLPLTFTTAEKLICFKEDSKILTIQGYIPIQDLRPGDLVKTYRNNYVSIDMIGKRSIYHPCDTKRIKDQLYKCSRKTYPEIFEDLVITGCHSILVNDFKNSQEKENANEVNGFLYVTDEKYRLPACCDERASVYEIPGTYTIYHLALENEDYCGNYGIYANGLLVETCSQRYLKELANMELIE